MSVSILSLQTITLQDSSSATEHIKVLKKSATFRIFATQNPNTGFFKGRREKLSAALINRFVPVIFKQLPDKEWEEVVTKQLRQGGLQDSDKPQELARQLVRLHLDVMAVTQDPKFPEVSFGQVGCKLFFPIHQERLAPAQKQDPFQVPSCYSCLLM